MSKEFAKNNINWAIVGTGYIANRFAQGMAVAEQAKLYAVCSRNLNTAAAFASKYQAEKTYDDFARLLADPNIDIIYLAVPNKQHFALIKKALDAGVAVLSEKPMVDNQEQFSQVLELARAKDVFLMEGMWSRFFPAMKQAKSWLDQGLIGEPVSLMADFSYDLDPDKDQPWKAGIQNHAGSLRDVGIYSLAFADLVFPYYPDHISAAVSIQNQVDQRMQLFFDYGDGRSAYLCSGFTHHGYSEAVIVGTKGKITVGPEFWHPTTARLYQGLELKDEFSELYPTTGFQFEIEAVQNCLRCRLPEPSEYTIASSFRVSHLIEDLRKDRGIFYPSDFV